MWLPFYISILRNVFEAQEDKILEIFDTCNGWEVWTQVEIALELKRRLPKAMIKAHTTAGSHERWEEKDVVAMRSKLCEFKREKQVYKGNQKRCDFAIKAMMLELDQLHCHFVELKCLTKGQIPGFIEGVYKDVQKIRQEKPDPSWADGAACVIGWAMAIAVVPLGEEADYDKLFERLPVPGMRHRRGAPMFDAVVKFGKTVWVWIEMRRVTNKLTTRVSYSRLPELWTLGNI